MGYDFCKIEKKWQAYWRDNKTYKVFEDPLKPKYYVLDMFPYPSGSGLSVGHPLGYIASDIYARYKRSKGFNVLHPMGYDSFGLPTEHYAIQTGIHPSKATEVNTKRYKNQLDQIGFSYDWDREVLTSSPEYYKWTQWIFKQFFNHYYCYNEQKAMPILDLISQFESKGNSQVNAASDDRLSNFTAEQWNKFSIDQKEKVLQNYRLAFLSETWVNWCEELGTVLANDEIKDGLSERGGHPVEQKLMKQWSLRITAYADRLLDDLSDLDWSDSIKEIQRNWIGKSKGAIVNFILESNNETISVFTTRPDTIFGVNFLVLSPGHSLIDKIVTTEMKDQVNLYVEQAKLKTERDRQSNRNVTGIFSGSYALHPFTKEPVAIWIGDYVLESYGTGAVMAVPCGDQRDWDFATNFNIDIINVFKDVDISSGAYESRDATIINSDFLNGLSVSKAIDFSLEMIVKNSIGSEKVNYRIRDAVFSRQRYWGEPFPIYYKGETPYILNDNEYVLLPEIDRYLPTSQGDPPLARAKESDWNIFKGDRMEHNVMPGWAGSSWYFLRYMDPANDKEFCSIEKSDYWGEVDLYIGGAEHAVGHLLYSRFWTKFLYDIGKISFQEPFKKMINQGMILGRSSFVYKVKDTNNFVSHDKKEEYDTIRLHVDISLVKDDILNCEKFRKWRPEYANAQFILNEDNKYLCGYEVEKMSKSKYNVQSPDDLVLRFGADTLRLYEMFLGPLEQFKPWETKGMNGVHNFLRKFWKLTHDKNDNFIVSDNVPTKLNYKTLHKTIKKVEADIERQSFNTVVSALMICMNELTEQKCNNRDIISDFTILISSYTPHISEEIWEKLGNKSSVTLEPFPMYNEEYLVENDVFYPVSFNGKTRFKMSLPVNLSQDEIQEEVMNHHKTKIYLKGESPKRVIIVPNKIVNIVI